MDEILYILTASQQDLGLPMENHVILWEVTVREIYLRDEDSPGKPNLRPVIIEVQEIFEPGIGTEFHV